MPADRFCFLCGSTNSNDLRAISSPSTQINEPIVSSLSDILQLSFNDFTVHSKHLCKKCTAQCREFNILSKKLSNLRSTIETNFNETLAKYHGKNATITSENIEIDTTSSIDESYPIEGLNFDQIGKEFPDETIVIAPNSQKVGGGKNAVLAKHENMSTLFDIDGIIQSDETQDSAFQTVILEQIDDGDYNENDVNEQLIVTESMDDDAKDYYESEDGHIIVAEKGEDYETYVYQDESNDNDSSTINDDQLDESQSGDDVYDTNEEMPFHSQRVKAVKSTKSDASSDRKLFIRDELNFQCILCDNQVIYDPQTISIHLKTDHNTRVYVCNVCGEDFQKRNPYNSHMEEHLAENRNGLYECENCQQIFDEIPQFRAHMRAHTSSQKIWTCKECNKRYSSKNLLDEHVNMHTGERPYKCPHCAKDFASKYTLTAHMKIHYDRKRPYECKECGKSFFSNQNLAQHERTHSGVKEYECDVCHKKFGTPHNLDVHKIVHTGHKPFICRTCGKAFARRAEIKDHERTHTGERPYKCDICNSSFAQRSNLMSHKRATHFDDKRYKCETCDRSFKRRRLLDYHIKAAHTGERPYKCDVCNATFVYPEHFKKHVRIHSGVKPFVCEVCGKAFNSRDNRNAHRYVHSDKKQYECTECGVGFMRKPLLYAHMEATGHLNNTIIVNQPHIKVDGNVKSDSQDEDSIDDQDIVYLNLNEDDLIEDDEYIMT